MPYGRKQQTACPADARTRSAPQWPKYAVAQFIGELQLLYSKAEPHKVEQDILGYLELLQKERALDFDV